MYYVRIMDNVTVSGEFQTQSEKAICLRVEDEDFWFPKSQMGPHERLDSGGDFQSMRGEEIDIEIPQWLADDKGVDYDV
mgnify:CR=1 FL=1